MVSKLVLLALIASLVKTSRQDSCNYGIRGSLTSTCTVNSATSFRSVSYRFDNLDETVRCVNCNLTTVPANTFDISGNQIKTLDLNNAQIAELKPKAFIGLVFLQRLVLTNNKIAGVPAGTFSGVNKIRVLNFENNSIAELVDGGFKELVNLEQLNLKNSQIAKVEVGAFDGLGSLQELNLANNKISGVAGVFRGLLSIASLNLESNKIDQLNAKDIDDLSTLVELNLAKNNLKTVAENAFLSIGRLETLRLSFNPIDSMTVNSFRGLYSLEELYLDHAALSTIEKGYWRQMRLLRMLDLSYNKLTAFLTGAFSALPELRVLNISHNNIAAYRKTGVFGLHSLHTLDLSYNKLTDFDYELVVSHLPSLALLELNHNPWPCYLGKEMEKYFQDDNLRFNLGQEYKDVKCNDSRPKGPAKEAPYVEPKPEKLVSESNGHEYVLYIFICITMGFLSFLFYLQYKTQKEIRNLVGRSNVSETQLLSSCDNRARDDF